MEFVNAMKLRSRAEGKMGLGINPQHESSLFRSSWFGGLLSVLAPPLTLLVTSETLRFDIKLLPKSPWLQNMPAKWTFDH